MTSVEKQFQSMLRGSGRPEDGYYLAAGDRVPSVTTVGSGLHPRGLFYWYWQKGKDGFGFNENPTPALEIGSLVHSMVEQRIHGETPKAPAVDDSIYERVMSGFNAFTRWWDANRFEVVATEVPLVSEKYRYGGTLDTILRDHTGALCLGDWKTSKALYADYLIQISAYGNLWNENAPGNLKLTGGFHLVRFSKEHGDMEHRHFPALELEFTQFLLLREAYDNNKAIEARAK
jgi:hypothetical protein